ncbi:hypothetical protein M9H77_12811 [Catharanthus roseus]|uniref:Uncharacterized protein n=1 Tax=Catharanthus roseus TaxID=4058 RepID=A0ACC0BIM8_CATRO|nr:hypothetical protein M9H77_12811 [Catharanthus roseus]
MATSENCQLFVHNGRHNHKIAVYSYGHAQAARLTEEQFRKSHVPPRNILRFFREQDEYNIKFYMYIKRDRMQGRNIEEEVIHLSAERGYTVFYRNGEDSNVLSDIVVAHSTSIAMLRTWPYVLIIDTTYKTNKYYSGLIVQHATIRMCRDDSNRQELHSSNSFYVHRTGNDIHMGSSTNQALIFYICYVGWSGY